MANEWEDSIKAAAQKFADALKNASQLNVTTNYVEVTGGGAEAPGGVKLAATTVIEIDGDNNTTVPIQTTAGGIAINEVLWDIHERNVNAAIAYRAQLLNSLLTAIQTRTR